MATAMTSQPVAAEDQLATDEQQMMTKFFNARHNIHKGSCFGLEKKIELLHSLLAARCDDKRLRNWQTTLIVAEIMREVMNASTVLPTAGTAVGTDRITSEASLNTKYQKALEHPQTSSIIAEAGN